MAYPSTYNPSYRETGKRDPKLSGSLIVLESSPYMSSSTRPCAPVSSRNVSLTVSPSLLLEADVFRLGSCQVYQLSIGLGFRVVGLGFRTVALSLGILGHWVQGFGWLSPWRQACIYSVCPGAWPKLNTLHDSFV